MRKPLLPRITEPDENKVHFMAPIGLDIMTLCGLTDFIGMTRGEETDEPVNCSFCQCISDHFKSHRNS